MLTSDEPTFWQNDQLAYLGRLVVEMIPRERKGSPVANS